MKRLVPALVFVAGACHRDPPQGTTNADASSADASTVVATAAVDASLLDGAVEPPSEPVKPAFLRFDPAGSFLHRARTANPSLTIDGIKPATLTPEQAKKADEIALALAANDRPPIAANTTMRDDLAAGLRKGRFDDTKLRADREAIARDVQPLLAAQVKALNELHALLTPPQRSYATVHAIIGRILNDKIGHVTTDRCRRWTKDLPIDDAKRKKIEAAVPAPQALVTTFDQRMAAVGTAFEKDVFDAAKLDELDSKKKAALPFDVEAPFLRQIAPLLDEKSRAIVADRFGAEDPASFRD